MRIGLIFFVPFLIVGTARAVVLNFDSPTYSGSASGAAGFDNINVTVPEPSGILLIGMIGLSCVRRGRG